MTRWWELNSDRWEREQQALRDAGIGFAIEQSELKRGKLVLNLSWKWDDQPLRLVAHFPTPYPFFPPMVVAPDLDLARHQTPGSKQLCLLARGGERWKPATDTLAELLVKQLPEVFAAQPGGAAEEFQGREAEPVTAYLHPEDGSFVGFPVYAIEQLPTSGTFQIGLEQLRPMRGTVIEVRDADGKRLFASEARDETYYTERKLLVATGRWVKLDSRPTVGSTKEYYALAAQTLQELERPLWQSIPTSNKGRLDVVALLFADELAWQKNVGNAIVISKFQDDGPDGKRRPIVSELERVELESRSNYFMRDPAADGLQKGRVTLVGAGSIGSPAAKFLAQGGIGSLQIVDHDILDAGNAIRWETGRSAAGRPKAHVLHQLIDANFPYTSVKGPNWKIGDPQLAGDPREPELYDQLFRNVDCLFDASASMPVNHYLSEMARYHGVPYVWMHATHGGWAGLVGRANPDRSKFCWMCHLYYLSEDRPGELKIDPLSSSPESDMVQPPGCLDPTFIGAQVDLAEVSLMGTRLVMDEVLTRTGARDAAAYDWNVATLQLRDARGRPQLPAWKAYMLPRHANCPNH